LAIFIVSVLVVSFINYRLLDSFVETKTKANLEIFTDSILAQIRHLEFILDITKQTLNEKHIAIARIVADMLDKAPGPVTSEELRRIAGPLDIIELNVADSNGIITASSIPKYIGFDYRSNEITGVYLKLVDGSLTELSEEPRASVFGGNLGDINHYTGLARKKGGFVQLGFNAGVIKRLGEEFNVHKTIQETKIGPHGFGMVLTEGLVTARPDGAASNVSGEGWYKAVSSGRGFAWIKMEGEPYYAGYKNENGHTVVGLVPLRDFYRERNQMLAEAAGLLFIAAAVMAGIVYLVMGGLLRPVDILVRGIEKIAKGNFDARVDGSYNDELDKIKDAVNSMAADIKTYMEGQILAESQLNESRISIMLSQIQPHFLYNALTAIARLCNKDPVEARKATINFAHYLRGNMESLTEKGLMPVEKELKHIEAYLDLEKAIYGTALMVVFNIESTDFELPTLSVQPIVENAVKHGIGRREGGGTVTVSVREAEDAHIITVADDGPGFDFIEYARTNDLLKCVGIENVRRRLAAMCGGSLDIESATGAGTTVTIRIPMSGKEAR